MTRLIPFVSHGRDPIGESSAAARETWNLPIPGNRRRRHFCCNVLAREHVITSRNDPLPGLGNQFDSLSLPGDVPGCKSIRRPSASRLSPGVRLPDAS